MSETVSARLQKELREHLVNECNDLGCSINDYIKDAVESKLNGTKTSVEPFSMEKAFEHIKECSKCSNAVIDKGYVLVSLEELRKHGLVPVKNTSEKLPKTTKNPPENTSETLNQAKNVSLI